MLINLPKSKRQNILLAYVVCGAWLWPLTPVAQTSAYRLLQQVDLKNALVSPYQNVLKMYDVAVDESRGRAYTLGSQTEYAAMIDIATGREIGSVRLPFAPQLNTLQCHPANGYLLVTTPSSSPVKMYAIDPANSRHTGTYTYETKGGGLAFDTRSNQIFLADGNAIKILDGNNLGLVTSFHPGFGAGGVAIDSLARTLYVVSRDLLAGNAVIKVFSLSAPYALLRTLSVPSAEVLGELILDASRQRLFLLGQRVVKTIDLRSGSVLATAYTSAATSSKVYSVQQQTLFMTDEDGYSTQGEHGSWGKIYRLHAASGVMDSVKMGDKPARLAIDKVRQVLVVPSMHGGIVELLHLDTNAVDTVDVGESADEFALSPNGESLYIVKRLGGSRVIRYDKITKQLSQMRAGNWPCVAEVDSTLGRLFVLNVYESNITVFDCQSNSVLDTIQLSILEGRTDAIPVMHLDQVSHQLYICFPEYEQMAVVNAATGREEKVVAIPGFHFDSAVHAAIGVIQLLAVPPHHKLLALQKHERKLKVFDMNSLALLDSVDLKTRWPNGSAFESNLLEYDAVSGKVFFGNLVIDPVNYRTIATLPALERVLGYSKDRRRLYGLSARGGEIVISEHDPASFALLRSQKLFQQSGRATPVFYYDAVANDLFIAEFNYAVLRHYDLDETTTSVADQPGPAAAYLLAQNYPNPFNPSTVIRFSLPRREHVTLKVFDVAGREVAILLAGEMPAGEHAVQFEAKGLASGLYFYQLETGQMIYHNKMLLTK